MPRKGENIYKRKDGRWEGRYIKSRTIEGKAVYGFVYAKSYKEVRKKLYEKKQNYIPSSFFITQKERKEEILFLEIASIWLKKNEHRFKESTVVRYENLLKLYILPVMGEKKMSEITNTFLERFCEQLLLCGGEKQQGLSVKTVSDVFSLLRNILSEFSEFQNIYFQNINIRKIKPGFKEFRILSQYEQKKLCEYLYENLDERNMGILLCLFSGIRIGEICALKWMDISLEEQVMDINKTMQRLQIKNKEKKTEVLISSPKSECSIRKIPLSSELIQLLKSMKKEGECYVLTGKREKYLEPRTMQNYFKSILKKCNIKDVNFHSLRHTFATRCVEVGFDIKSLSEILGHANVNITMNRYVHPSMKLKKENMEKLAPLFAVTE